MRYTVSLFIIFNFFLFASFTEADEHEINGVKADYILVDKSEKRLSLFAESKLIKTYKVALGKKPVGHKAVEGDMRTPEGIYYIDGRKSDSKYHLALRISYPNEIDTFFAEKLGVSAGGNIMIHGTGDEYAWMGKYHVVHDWTDGCIAVTNHEIEEIWTIVPDGTKVKITP